MIGFAEYRIGAQPGAQERKGRQGRGNKLGSWQDKSRTVRHGRECGRQGVSKPLSHRTGRYRTVRHRDFALLLNPFRTVRRFRP